MALDGVERCYEIAYVMFAHGVTTKIDCAGHADIGIIVGGDHLYAGYVGVDCDFWGMWRSISE